MATIKGTLKPKGPLVGNRWEAKVDPLEYLDRLIGIEIEAETVGLENLCEPESNFKKPLAYCPAWYGVKDGSLRFNGAEFVSIPHPISETPGHVAELFEFVRMYCPTWTSSVRTGIHVHVNARDFGDTQLQTFMVTYALLEPALFEFVGRDREECIYCVPWYRATNDARATAAILGEGQQVDLVTRLALNTPRLAKYSALYMGPLSRIGTLEFRMAPTWLDEEHIVRWARICERIVSFSAQASRTFYNVLEKYDSDPSGFVQEVCDGLLPIPLSYEHRVLNSGADFLARTLFPPESGWVRTMQHLELFGKSATKLHVKGHGPQLSLNDAYNGIPEDFDPPEYDGQHDDWEPQNEPEE